MAYPGYKKITDGSDGLEDHKLYASFGGDEIIATDGDDIIYNIGVIDYSSPTAFSSATPGYTLNRDSVSAGNGNDTVKVQGFFVYYDAVNLKFDGGAGNETLDFSQSDAYTAVQRTAERAGVLVDLAGGAAYTYYLHDTYLPGSNQKSLWEDVESHFSISGFENVTGTDQGDYINGDDNANVLDGGTLDYSSPAPDRSKYNANKDVINGNGGNDTFKVQGFYAGGVYDGGAGIDTVDFSSASNLTAERRASEHAGIHLSLQNQVVYTYFQNYSYSDPNNGAWVWTDQEGLITLKDIENVVGTNQNDYIYGKDDVANTLYGGGGDDYVTPNSQVIDYGSSPMAFSGSYSGFIDGDTLVSADIFGVPVFSGGGTNAGAYDISYLSGLASGLGYTFANNAASVGELVIRSQAIDDAKIDAQNGIETRDANPAALKIGSPVSCDAGVIVSGVEKERLNRFIENEQSTVEIEDVADNDCDMLDDFYSECSFW